jgi:hypothetical protein
MPTEVFEGLWAKAAERDPSGRGEVSSSCKVKCMTLYNS